MLGILLKYSLAGLPKAPVPRVNLVVPSNVKVFVTSSENTTGNLRAGSEAGAP